MKPESSSKITFQHNPFRNLILDYQNMIRLGSEMLAVFSNQHKFDTKICLISLLKSILWISDIIPVLMNYKYFMKPKLSDIHTKSCCNDIEIGSLVGNWQSAKIELQQLKKWAITPQKIFQPWCCSP